MSFESGPSFFESNELVKNISEKVKRFIAIGMATAVLYGAVDIRSAYATESGGSVGISDRNDSSKERGNLQESFFDKEMNCKVEIYKEGGKVKRIETGIDYKDKIGFLGDDVLHDPVEKIIVGVEDKSGNWKFIERQGESKNTGIENEKLVQGDIREAVRQGAQDIVKIHTHPLAVYNSKEDIAAINKNETNTEKIKPGITVPSMEDVFRIILSDIIEDDNASKIGEKCRNIMVDPTGVWEYSIDRNNENIKEAKNSIQKGLDNLVKDAANEINISEEEREKIENLKEADEFPVLSSLTSDSLSRKMTELVKKEVNNVEIKFADNINLNHEKYSEITMDLATVSSRNDVEAKLKKLNNFIAVCKERGFIFNYKPFLD